MKQSNARILSADQCVKLHEESQKFLDALVDGDADQVKNFLFNMNVGPKIEEKTSKTIVLMDATGSMGSFLDAAKNTVSTMFELAAATLKANGFPADAFQLQFIAYRDYDCKAEIIQASGWQSNPLNLRNFMEKVSPKGGGDYEEAIEIGLQICRRQAEGLSQVILIADAPAKKKDQIISYRNQYLGEPYWAREYGPAITYEDEVQFFTAKQIPIHTFYLVPTIRAHFESIATATGGKSRELNVRHPGTAEFLTNFVVEEVLRKCGSDDKQGQMLAEYFLKHVALKVKM